MAYVIETKDIGEALFLKNKDIVPDGTKEAEIGLWCELTEDGLFYQVEILNGDRNPIQLLSEYIHEARRLNIPGLYTVPEFGVKDAPFWKVLEAVKAYYEKKAGLKEAA